jgi:hypothetical protein
MNGCDKFSPKYMLDCMSHRGGKSAQLSMVKDLATAFMEIIGIN